MRLNGRKGADGIQFLAVFQGLQSPFGAFQHLCRHTGHTGHVDTEAVGHSSPLELAQEQYVVPLFLYGNMPVMHAREAVFHVVELVVMGSEESLGAMPFFVYILYEGAGYGHAVVGGCTAADLVHQHQRTLGKIVHDHRRLQHLHHERGLAP